MDYELIEWPEVQQYMEYDWFREECHGAQPSDEEEGAMWSYFVPKHRLLELRLAAENLSIADDSLTVPEIELSYRRVPGRALPIVNMPERAQEVLRATWNENKIELLEEFKILLVDNNNQCLGVVPIASGGLHSCTIDPRLIFAVALKAKASAIILAHNHPSGQLAFSQSDIRLTEKLALIGELLEIKVLDHQILTATGHKSMAQANLMP